MERHIGSPVVNTVDTASRISGVQTGVRWWLQRNDSSTRDQNKKRRRIEEVNGDEVDVERGLEAMIPQDHIQRRFSELSFGEPLPAYDDQRAPNYQEKQSAEEHGGRTNLSRIGEWQRRLMMSTSGLSAALSEESLRNLRHCLQWLRWANNHISQKIMALREVLDGGTRPKDNEQHGTSKNDSPATDKSDPSVISQRISALDRSIREALKHVIGIVDKFTGSALPENARSVVKRYIVTFPQRFQLVNMMARDEPEFSPQGPYAAHPPETIANSRRALVFALEGLNMLVQITTVLDGTIASAEDWIASFGRSVAKEANSDEKSARSPATDEKQVIKESPAQNERVVTDGISIPTRRSDTLPSGTDPKMEKTIVADSADFNITDHNSEHFVSS